MWRERVRRRKANRRAFLQSITTGDKVMYAHTAVDGFYAGVADYSPFVLQDVSIAFGGGLRPTIPTFSTEFPSLSIVDLSSFALPVMNGQLLSDSDTAYSDYVMQAVLNAMNVMRLKNDASVDMANGVRDWEGSEG